MSLDKLCHHYIKVMSLCYVASKRIQELLGALLKYKNALFNGVEEKESIICVRMG